MMMLSFSSLNDVYTCPRTWLNKQLGITKEVFPYFTAGREAHAAIQGHISGKKPDARLSNLKYSFEIVEEKDFDERTYFEIPVGGHIVRGYNDALSPAQKMFGEIKPGWNLKKFLESMQRKIYVLARPEYTHALLITYTKEPLAAQELKLPNREKDKEDALKWIQGGIDIINKGDYEPPKGVDCYRCVFRQSCAKSNYNV